MQNGFQITKWIYNITAKQVKSARCRIEFHCENHRIHSGGLEFSDCWLLFFCFVILFIYLFFFYFPFLNGWCWPIIIFRMNKFVCAYSCDSMNSIDIRHCLSVKRQRWKKKNLRKSLQILRNVPCRAVFGHGEVCVFFFCLLISYKTFRFNINWWNLLWRFFYLVFSIRLNCLLIDFCRCCYYFFLISSKGVRTFARFTCHSINRYWY